MALGGRPGFIMPRFILGLALPAVMFRFPLRGRGGARVGRMFRGRVDVLLVFSRCFLSFRLHQLGMPLLGFRRAPLRRFLRLLLPLRLS